MDSRSIILAMLVIWISGCASVQATRAGTADEQKARTFADIYRQAKQADKTAAEGVPALSLDAPMGVVKPYLPVIRPPRVIKVWVPAHIANADKNIMISGHWSFVMLEKTRWFIEGEGR
ncbi:MAG: hypothetical protein HQL20_07685 [Candidatus Omnitrophica bacterium]|nr:hypothetical protein [Candidatus Omnitrophota bacterium]